jgi:hypothetical protein
VLKLKKNSVAKGLRYSLGLWMKMEKSHKSSKMGIGVPTDSLTANLPNKRQIIIF